MKEITLEELENFTTNNVSQNQPAQSNIMQKPIIKSNINNASSISTEELSKKLKESHGVTSKDDTTEEAPLVKNAFSDMLKTLDDRKKRIEEEIMPIIEKNAEEMAEAEEMGIDTSKEKLDDNAIKSHIKNKIEESNNINKFNINDDTSDIDKILEEDTNNMEEDITYTDINETTTPAVVNESQSFNKKETTEDEVSQYTAPQSEDDEESELDKLIDDLNKEDNNIAEDETTEDLRSRFKESLSSVKIARDTIDFSKFKIKQNAVSSSAVLSSVNNKINAFKKADWVLYHTGRSMTFTECRGPELNSLRKTISSSNDINGVISSLQFIYNHTIDANKPSFEAWCKLIRTEDVESLYFGLYRACYADSNIVARSCENDKCKKTSLVNTDIKSMVKFKDKETEERFNKIYNHDTTTATQETESELIQISDYFAISFSHPTLYSTFLQYATLSSDVTKKYSETLNTMAYIDGFYSIDYDTQELIPIAIKTYKNNINKTVINKLKTYIEILKTLTNDQYNVLTAKLNNIIQEPKVTYIYPEVTCPECGATIKEEPIDSVMRLLFTRAQLVQVKSL